MSVREEDKEKSSCSGRGLGVAVAAIGVGVGAALCCFCNQRNQNPNSHGSTTNNWHTEHSQTFHHNDSNPDSFTTISEYTTTDTSMIDTDMEEFSDCDSNSDSTEFVHDTSCYSTSDDTDDNSERCGDVNSFFDSDDESDSHVSHDSTMDTNTNSDTNENSTDSSDDSFMMERLNDASDNSVIDINDNDTIETGYLSMNNVERFVNDDSDPDVAMEWDVTRVSSDVPMYEEMPRSPLSGLVGRLGVMLGTMGRKRTVENEERKARRELAFRERSWTLEECSICFDVMLNTQQLMKLPCAHNFHTDCIMPWLQERQTCPNCRKVA